jgi:hypothetical protein
VIHASAAAFQLPVPPSTWYVPKGDPDLIRGGKCIINIAIHFLHKYIHYLKDYYILGGVSAMIQPYRNVILLVHLAL